MLTIHKEESSAIDSLRLICILSVVMIHCSLFSYSLTHTLLPETKSTLNDVWEILRLTPNPLQILFLLSGYLFFRNVKIGEYNWKIYYFNKLKSRIITLGLFLISWNIIGFVAKVYILNYPTPTLSEFINGFWPTSNHEHSWGRGMWFIRSLIVFSLFSPIYYFIVKNLKHLTLILFIFLSFHDIDIQNRLFNIWLLLGSYLAICGISLSSITKNFNWKTTLVLFIVLHISKPLLPDIPGLTTVEHMLGFLGIFGLVLAHPISQRLTIASTFIYGAHFFTTGIFKRIFFHLLPQNVFGGITNMVLDWILSIILCYLCYSIMCKSRILSLCLTGGRVK